MSQTLRSTVQAGHSTSVAHVEARRTTNVARSLALLRKAVQSAGFTLEALASAMGRDLSYKGYISRVMNGEKPYTLEFEADLPDDVLKHYRQFQAESHGYVVVEEVDEDTARRHLAAGFLSLLSPKRNILPDKAERMVRVEPAAERRHQEIA